MRRRIFKTKSKTGSLYPSVRKSVGPFRWFVLIVCLQGEIFTWVSLITFSITSIHYLCKKEKNGARFLKLLKTEETTPQSLYL